MRQPVYSEETKGMSTLISFLFGFILLIPIIFIANVATIIATVVGAVFIIFGMVGIGIGMFGDDDIICFDF